MPAVDGWFGRAFQFLTAAEFGVRLQRNCKSGRQGHLSSCWEFDDFGHSHTYLSQTSLVSFQTSSKEFSSWTLTRLMNSAINSSNFHSLCSSLLIVSVLFMR